MIRLHPLANFERTDDLFCLFHKERLTYICLNDDVPLCVMCANFDEGDHFMHTVVKLEDCVSECLRQREEYDERMNALKTLAKEQATVLDHQRAHIDK